jgi:hypothetical protein
MTGRRQQLIVGLMMASLAGTGRPTFAATPDQAASDLVRAQLNVLVEIQNYALVSKGTLHSARLETARVFSRMGIQIEWREGPKSLSDVNIPAFSILMLSRSMAASKANSDCVPPMTLAISSKNTGRAYVFWDRVAAAAREQVLSDGLLLSHVMTHELGHMTANIGHDGLGIMRPFLELREAGFFGFTSPEKAAIRATLQRALDSPVPMIALRAAPGIAR